MRKPLITIMQMLCVAAVTCTAGVGNAQTVSVAVDKAQTVTKENDSFLSGPVHDVSTWSGNLPRLQFGEPLPWETVTEMLPRMATAEIIDFETGRSFVVQRRAGSRHADVQPLTKQDSQTMKEIYDGQWSWRRRAVLIKIGDRFVAASMNGMPHGAGAISGNNFRGHFCLHFNGSSTHKLRKLDPGHQLMIWKASGQLNDVVRAADPNKLVDICVAALKERDLFSLQLILDDTDKAAVEALAEMAGQIDNVRVINGTGAQSRLEQRQIKRAQVPQSQSQRASKITGNSVEIPMRLQLLLQPDNTKRKGEITFRLTRTSLSERWKVDPKPLLKFLTAESGE